MKWKRSELRNRVELGAYRLAKGTVGRAGPGLSEPFGTLLGDLFHAIPGRRRQVLDFNLELAFPEIPAGERRRLGRAVARHFGRGLLATLRIQRTDPAGLEGHVNNADWSRVEEAVAKGNGLFLLTAHLGSWEVAGLMCSLHVPKRLSFVHRPLDNPLLEAELEAFRRRFGSHALPKRGVTRPMIAAIRRGETVGILVDQRANERDGIDVPFFGHPACTHTGLARIVLKTRTPVIPLWCYAERGGRFSIVIDPPVEVTADDDVEGLTSRFSAITEDAIRRRPDQWLWYHDRWRDLRLASGR